MGSNDIEHGSKENEWPAHLVIISKPFYIGKYEITQAQYKEIIGDNPSHFKDDYCPVENVSWHNAMEFCRRLSTHTKGSFRLPTEAEWEYACRAGTKTAYCSGNDQRALRKVGWYSLDGRRGSARRTKPVGQFEPNRWGLYDMHGNVWEWCLDRYGRYTPGQVIDPNGLDEGEYRVVRGGGWYMDALNCRSASRRGVDPEAREDSLRFRIVHQID